MTLYLTIKVIHIISSCVLLGTGVGIAFYMFRSWSEENLQQKLFAAKNTVVADFLFTLPAVVIQPLSGAWLVWKAGFDWTSTWLLASIVLYLLIGLCWLPVVWIQIKLHRQIKEAIDHDRSLPANYQRLFRIWFLLGWPAFISLIAIFFLMVVKPI